MQAMFMWGILLFAALPATSNYRLNSYGFGSGGTTNSQTATYSLEGTAGELSGQTSATSNSTVKPGYIETSQANVPKLASLDNNSGQYYNRLHFVIDTQNNPSDATYLISVSTDNFASDTRYLQPDGTLSSSLVLGDYQTYSAWGGSGGGLIIGLDPSTTYYVRLKATHGIMSESAYGPVSSQATGAPSLSFSLVTSSQSVPPFSVSLGSLSAGTVTTSADSITTGLSTNGLSGANIYIRSQNGGLLSGSTGFKIDAVSTDLDTSSHGFGAQSSSVSQSSGGPFAVVSPYGGGSNNVGIVSSTTRSLYTTSAPITAASGVLRLKAKASNTDIAASDYQEILTFIAAGNF